MASYPLAAMEAAIKCISCNAPATRTVEQQFVCVECSNELITPNSEQVGADED